MATINEKIVDMLATVREMREKLNKPGLFDLISQNDDIAQSDLMEHFKEISPRTLRRRLDILVQEKQIFRERKGREVLYRRNDNYPQ